MPGITFFRVDLWQIPMFVLKDIAIITTYQNLRCVFFVKFMDQDINIKAWIYPAPRMQSSPPGLHFIGGARAQTKPSFATGILGGG